MKKGTMYDCKGQKVSKVADAKYLYFDTAEEISEFKSAYPDEVFGLNCGAGVYVFSNGAYRYVCYTMDELKGLIEVAIDAMAQQWKV